MTVHLENCTLFHDLSFFFSSLPAGLFFWPAVITPTPFTSSVVYFCECSLFYTLAFLQTQVVGRWRFSLSRWGHLLEVSTMTPQQPVKSLWALRHSSFGPFRAIRGRVVFFFFQQHFAQSVNFGSRYNCICFLFFHTHSMAKVGLFHEQIWKPLNMSAFIPDLLFCSVHLMFCLRSDQTISQLIQ